MMGNTRRNKVRVGFGLALVIMMLLVTGCGSQYQSAATTMMGYAAETTAAAMVEERYDKSVDSVAGAASPEMVASTAYSNGDQMLQKTPSNVPAGRKIIKEGSANIETIAYDESLATLFQMINDMGGYVESQNLSGGGIYQNQAKFATIAFRIPSERFEEAFQGLSKVGSVSNNQSYGSDITDQYADTEVRIESLLVQEKRLLELVAKAEKIEDIVALEARMSDIRYQIESMQNSLNNYDRLLSYSRITVNIQEVQKVSENKPLPKTLGERMNQAFADAWDNFVTGLQDFVVWIAESIFGLVFWLIVFVVMGLLLRKVLKKRKKASVAVVEKPKE